MKLKPLTMKFKPLTAQTVTITFFAMSFLFAVTGTFGLIFAVSIASSKIVISASSIFLAGYISFCGALAR